MNDLLAIASFINNLSVSNPKDSALVSASSNKPSISFDAPVKCFPRMLLFSLIKSFKNVLTLLTGFFLTFLKTVIASFTEIRAKGLDAVAVFAIHDHFNGICLLPRVAPTPGAE